MNNNVVLYEGLFVFRNAMLSFILEQLQKAYGKGWWSAGIQRALGDTVSANLEKQFQRRYGKELAAIKRPGQEVYEMLDIGHFLPIIQRNWKGSFASVFGQQDTTEVWLREVIDVRNAVAHPESQPLNDDDAWRAIDTMVRLVQVIDPDAAEQISHTKKNIGQISQSGSVWLDMKDGPYDYQLGFTQLDDAMSRQEGQDSEIYRKLLGHKQQLVTALWEKRLTPGVQSLDVEGRLQRIIAELNRLSQQYLAVPFIDLCVTPKLSSGQDALASIQGLEYDIQKLQKALYRKQWKRLAQLKTGETIATLEREIENLQETIDAKREELAHIKDIAAPSAFFSVQRILTPNGRISYVEGQPVSVTVTIQSEGSETRVVSYIEQLPDCFELLEGVIQIEESIAPGNNASFCYRFLPRKAGNYQILSGDCHYAGRAEGWDHLAVTAIEVRPGTEPFLVAQRYYQYEKNGIKLLLHITNKGDKPARNVEYEEALGISQEPKQVVLNGTEKMILGGAEYLIEHPLSLSDVSQITFEEDAVTKYQDDDGKVLSCPLALECKRIEYKFPTSTDIEWPIIGRDTEVKLLESLLDNIWSITHGKTMTDLKRLVFIAGIEGTGKTRLVHHLLLQAQQRKFAYYAEDVKDRSPVKRMLRRMLGLYVDEDRDELIWETLEEKLPGLEYNLHRQTLFAFISTLSAELDKQEFFQLEASVLILVRKLCRNAPVVLVFENIHWTPEGIEQELLLSLFRNVLVSRDPVLLCATYRPSDFGQISIMDKLQLPRNHYELIELLPLKKPFVGKLVNQIIDFPRFSDSLHRFIEDWSGNPFYIIELLRLLTYPDSKYLYRVGEYWHPSQDVDLARAIPERISDVIIERVELELSDVAALAKILAAIGFELPYNLIIELVSQEFPEMSKTELEDNLILLEKAGIISLFGDRSYQFEHQLKREVLYDSLPKQKRQGLRQKIAEILLKQKIFADVEQTRQLARHLIKSSKEFQQEHINEIWKAATLEYNLRNFSRSLEFYEAIFELLLSEDFQMVSLLIDRSRLHQLRGNWLLADRDLENAYHLVIADSTLAKQEPKRAAQLQVIIEKEKARVMLNQPQASLTRINTLLYRARIGLEGNFRLKGFFLPNDLEFHRNLMEVYLILAEVFLRKRDFKMCRRICRRVQRIGQHAFNKWQNESLLHEAYRLLGDLHFKRAHQPQDFAESIAWYDKALKYATNDRYQTERTWLKVAEAYQALDDNSQALVTYEKAIQIQKELGDSQGLALSFGGVGNILVEQDEFMQGLRYCEQAYEYQKLVGDVERFWRTCISLTKIYSHNNDLHRASEYWLQARIFLFDEGRVSDLRLSKQREICELNQAFNKYFSDHQDWEKWLVCLRDLDHLMPLLEWERDGLAAIQMNIGEANLKMLRWQEAITAFKQVIEVAQSSRVRAEALESLGDVYSTYELPQRSLSTELTSQDEIIDQAETYYEEATKLWLHIGDRNRALGAYEKLLNRTITDEAGLLQLPFTFLRIIRYMSLEKHTYEPFIEKAVEVLLRNDNIAEAGDIVVYAAREIAKLDNTRVSVDSTLRYLRQAEEIYRKGADEDLIWGLNMLIPTYFRLSVWGEITRCFEELFELYVQVENVDEFIETYSAVGELRDYADVETLEHLAILALTAQNRIHLSSEQQSRFFLYVAKGYSHLADKVDNADLEREYEDLALHYYDEILQGASDNSSIRATALNDSALIYKHRENNEEALHRYDQAIQLQEFIRNYKGAAETRVNRARLYQEVGDFDKAYTEYEQAIGPLQRRNDYWDHRLSFQDEQPLSRVEIVNIRADKDWFASAALDFASLLLIHRQQIQWCKELAQMAANIFEEIDMTERAQMAKRLVSIPEITEVVPEQILLKRIYSCPVCDQLIIQGMTECPACGQMICRNCGAAVSEDDEVCPVCDNVLPVFCSECGKEVGVDDQVCPYCGASFDEE